METLPNRSRYQSFAVKVYVVAADAAVAAVLVVVGLDNVADVDDYDVGETMMASCHILLNVTSECCSASQA